MNGISDNEDKLTAILLDDDDELDLIAIEVEELNEVTVVEEAQPQKEKPSVIINDFLERRRAQFKSKTRSKKQYAFLMFMIVLSIATMIVLILESPLYDVDKVNVKNTSASKLSEQEMKQVSAITSTIKGEQTYRLKLKGIKNKLSELPYIKSVETSKEWPSTVDVTLFRRVPVGVVETDQGYVLVDQEGIVFEKTSTPDKSLPIFDGMKTVTLTKQIPNMDYVQAISDAPTDMNGQIARITKQNNTYTVLLADGITIKLGNDKQIKEKLAIAWSIIVAKGRKDIGYIDVSVPSIPVSGPPELS